MKKKNFIIGKFLTVILTVCLIFTLMACGQSSTGSSSATTGNSTTTASSTTTGNSTTTVSSTTTGNNSTTANKTLVVYFSATGNTKNVAQYIAETVNADLVEIVAANPYTSDDINYGDSNSRTTKEQNDKSSRPAISNTIANWSEYTTVYIGHPIWWGEEPRIMDTFVESYDFTGKTVIPFCTSASSGVGNSASNLASLAKGSGKWLSGYRFGAEATLADVKTWIAGLSL